MFSIPVIDTKAISVSIPEETLIPAVGIYTAENISKLAKLYLNMGGDRNATFLSGASSTVIAAELELRLNTIVKEALDATKVNRKKNVTSVEWMSSVIASSGGPAIVVLVEVNYWSHMCTTWFEYLKERDPKVYPFFARFLSNIMSQSFTSADEIERYDLLNQYDEVEDKGMLTEIQAELDKIEAVKRRSDYATMPIEKQYSRIKRKLTKTERHWVELSIETLKLLKTWTWQSIPVWHEGEIPEAFMERVDFQCGFMVSGMTEDENGIVAGMLESVNQSYGEAGPPCILCNIKTKYDLGQLVCFINYYLMFQRLFDLAQNFGRSYEKRRAAKKAKPARYHQDVEIWEECPEKESRGNAQNQE